MGSRPPVSGTFEWNQLRELQRRMYHLNTFQKSGGQHRFRIVALRPLCGAYRSYLPAVAVSRMAYEWNYDVWDTNMAAKDARQ